jgi:hypothetical protein
MVHLGGDFLAFHTPLASDALNRVVYGRALDALALLPLCLSGCNDPAFNKRARLDSEFHWSILRFTPGELPAAFSAWIAQTVLPVL